MENSFNDFLDDIHQYLDPKKLLTTFIRWIENEGYKQKMCHSCLILRMWSLIKGNKIIKDPVYGSIKLESDDIFLIDTCFFQRLRYLRQTGFLNFVIPTATHTRFDHSIGVYYWAREIFKSIKNKGELEGLVKQIYNKFIAIIKKKGLKNINLLDDDKVIIQSKKGQIQLDFKMFYEIWSALEYYVVKYSALLHDIAHYPFSHSGESLIKFLCVAIYKILTENRKHEAGKPKKFDECKGEPRRFNEYCKELYIKGGEKSLERTDLNNADDLVFKSKPHEIDASRLILEQEIRKEIKKEKKKGYKKYENCINRSLEYLLTWKVKEVLRNFKIDYNSIPDNIKFLMGIHPKALIFKIAMYIPNRDVLKKVFESKKEFKWAKDYVNHLKDGLLDYNVCSENYAFQRLINDGGFDIDKLDYITRDSFFLGLELQGSEIKRIINGIHLAATQKNDNNEFMFALDYKILGDMISYLIRRLHTLNFLINHKIHRIIENEFNEHLKERINKVLKENIDDPCESAKKIIQGLQAFRKKADYTILEELRSYFKKSNFNFDSSFNLFSTLIARNIDKTLAIIITSEENVKRVLSEIERETHNLELNGIKTIKFKLSNYMNSLSSIYIYDASSKKALALNNSAMNALISCLPKNCECCESSNGCTLNGGVYIIYILLGKNIVFNKIKGIKELREFLSAINKLLRSLKNKFDLEIIIPNEILNKQNNQ